MYITATSVQTNAPWGIARLSTGRTSLAGGNPRTFSFNFVFDDSAGFGTEAYIIDTGCRTTHQDYGGRAHFLASFGRGAPDQDINGREYPCSRSYTPSMLRDGLPTQSKPLTGDSKSHSADCPAWLADAQGD